MQVTGFSFSIRLVHMVCFELIAIVLFAPITAIILNKAVFEIGILGLTLSLMAMLWNFIYNYGFDYVEGKLGRERFKRTVVMRITHAFLFEAGLLFATLPVVAAWLHMSLWHAFILDMGFVVFFLIYAFIYNWVFDRIYLWANKIPV
ncbi:PACE efflux transporter [Facilibium subflavum]|uniref:PACE efflux transporter n=1 Tax=Facilibium subflavum TaxID=2219058 RepID=UPI000E65A22E|nr:PACE efflux transporter [Facilibium subflavum]